MKVDRFALDRRLTRLHEQCCRFEMAGLFCKVLRSFSVVRFEIPNGSAGEQRTNHARVPVLRGGMQWCIAALLADVRIGAMFEKEYHDLDVPGRGRGLNGCRAERIIRARINRCA